MGNILLQAADLLYPVSGRRTLNIKFGAPARGRHMSAAELAAMLIHADTEVREGRARLVEDVDGLTA